jgi:hypothetical protein
MTFEQFWEFGGAEASGRGGSKALVDIRKREQVPLEFLEFWM